MGGGLTYNLGAHIIDQAVQLLGVPDAVFADIDTIRTGGMVDDYFVIHLLRPSKAPRVKVTLKSSYLMCEPEPRFILHGTEGSFVKYGLDRQEADLNDGQMPGTPYWELKTKVPGDFFTQRKTATSSITNIPVLPEIMQDFTTTSTVISATENRS